MKRIIACLTALLVITGTLPAFAQQNNMNNRASSWSQEDISQARLHGFLPEDFTDDLSAAITRAQFCELVYNLMDSSMDISWRKTSPAPFHDATDEKQCFLALEKIINGKGDYIFAPNDPLTREEAAVISDRIVQYAKLDSSAKQTADVENNPTENCTTISDDGQISSWARTAVHNMLALGIMSGTDVGFQPREPYTKEQAVAVIMRLYRLLQDQKPNCESTEAVRFADRLNALMPAGENYMFSPLSVKMAFALAANGADGKTQQEILNTLGINNLEEYNVYAKKLMELYSASDIIKLNIANSIWMNRSRSEQNFSAEYQKKIEDYYKAAAKEVSDSDAVKEINNWVSQQTNDKIRSIISTPDFSALLANAVYFKGSWKNPFSEEEDTAKDEFTDRDGTKSQIDFMHKTARFHYLNRDGIQAVELPYQNRSYNSTDGENTNNKSLDADISMYLLMSDKDINAGEFLYKNIKDFQNTKIKLSIPKFEMTFSTSLKDALQSLGIHTAFLENEASFSNMFDHGNMFISNVLHKTYINVNEKETEAAAVTAIVMETTSVQIPEPPLELKFNKPFTFVIRDNSNNEILFIGEYAFTK